MWHSGTELTFVRACVQSLALKKPINEDTEMKIECFTFHGSE